RPRLVANHSNFPNTNSLDLDGLARARHLDRQCATLERGECSNGEHMSGILCASKRNGLKRRAVEAYRDGPATFAAGGDQFEGVTGHPWHGKRGISLRRLLIRAIERLGAIHASPARTALERHGAHRERCTVRGGERLSRYACAVRHHCVAT